MHSVEVNRQSTQRSKLEMIEKRCKEFEHRKPHQGEHLPNSDLNLDEMVESSKPAIRELAKQQECCLGYNDEEDPPHGGTEITSIGRNLNSCYSDNNSGDIQRKVSAGAIWDVFRRQDVPKLNEFLRVHWDEFTSFAAIPVNFSASFLSILVGIFRYFFDSELNCKSYFDFRSHSQFMNKAFTWINVTRKY